VPRSAVLPSNRWPEWPEHVSISISEDEICLLLKLLGRKRTFERRAEFAARLRKSAKDFTELRLLGTSWPSPGEIRASLQKVLRLAEKLSRGMERLDGFSQRELDTACVVAQHNRTGSISGGGGQQVSEAITLVRDRISEAIEQTTRTSSHFDQLRADLCKHLVVRFWNEYASDREAEWRVFVARVLKLLGWTYPDPMKSPSQFDRIIGRTQHGEYWVQKFAPKVSVHRG
jgi:hypothetical protein